MSRVEVLSLAASLLKLMLLLWLGQGSLCRCQVHRRLSSTPSPGDICQITKKVLAWNRAKSKLDQIRRYVVLLQKLQ